MNIANLLSSLPSSELKRAIEIKEKIERLESELNSIVVGAGSRGPGRPRKLPAVGNDTPRAKRNLSPEGRARIAAAARARWARQKAEGQPAASNDTVAAAAPAEPAKRGRKK